MVKECESYFLDCSAIAENYREKFICNPLQVKNTP